MKKFIRILVVAILSGLTFFPSNAQSVLNPADPIVNYDSLNPPTQPPYGQIGKWVRRPSLNWNTESYKAYVYKGVPFRLKFPKSYAHGVADGKKYPILMFWHGLLEAGDIYDNEYSMFLGAQLFRDYVDNGTFDGFVIFMQAPINGGSFFAPGHFQFMTEIIDYMTVNNKLDPFRIISNGLSSGGMATFNVFLQHPNYVSSVIMMSGPGNWGTSDVIEKSKYTPVWYAHGGEDNNPDLFTGNQNNDAMVAAGANWRRVMYPGAYHDTWGATWWDPDFWPFVNRSYSSNPWSLFNKKLFAPGEAVNATLGLAPGYDQYEWRRNGVLIPGATTRSITVTQLGIYDARVRRGTVWSEWSKIPVELKEGTIVVPPPPPPGSATRIEAESFTSMFGIQSEPTSDVGGGLNIGWQDNNDWLNYSVNVPTAGTYTLSFRVASAFGGATFQLRKSDGTPVSTVTVPNTNGFQTWQTIYALATLPAGQQTLRIYTTNSNGGWNINWWEIPGTPNGGSGTNQPPVANAGTNQTITLPVNSVTLNGSGTDADGTISAYAWTKVSGPAGGTITSPSQASTTVTGLTQGAYVFRLTVTDNAGATGSADVTITVNGSAPPNQAPTSNAGSDQTITLPASSTTLSGSGTDADGSISSYAWSKISGPAGGTIATPSQASTSITNLAQGTYTFRLTVTDNLGATGSDDVMIIVNSSTPPGGSIKIEAENYSNMAGIQTEPTNDVGGGLNVGWQDTNDWMDYGVNISSAGSYTVNFRVATVFNGPTFQLRNAAGTSLATISVPNTGGFQNWTTISASVNLPAGAQTLRIYTTNAAGGWNINWWEITGASSGTNQSPVANAGSNQVITLPSNSATLTGSGSDADGSIVSYAWSKVSGPSGGTIASPSQASTSISNLVEGIYTYRLTVTDNAGATGSADVTITVNPATTPPPPTGSIKIEAESYSNMSGIQTEPTNDAGGGLNVGWQDTNDWMDYAVNLSGAGTYTVNFRVATIFNGPTFQVRNAAGTVLATIAVPNTGGFQNWTTVSSTITLPAGVQTLRIFTSNAASGWNINWWEIVGTSGGSNQVPVANAGSDQSITLPTSSATLSGSGSDADGSIVSYAWTKISGPTGGNIASPSQASTSVTNLSAGGYVFRLTVTDNQGATGSDDVTITVDQPAFTLKIEAETYTTMSGISTENTQDAGGGLNVRSIDEGDWMNYTVNIPAAGTYEVNFRVAAVNNGSQLQLRNSSGTVLLTLSFSRTFSGQSWKTITGQVTLPAGTQTLRIYGWKANGGWSLNWWEIKTPTAAPVVQNLKVALQEEVLTKSGLNIYPNPVTDAMQLVVNNENKGRMKIQVSNLAGEIVKEIQLEKPSAGAIQTRLSLGSLPPGVYIIRTGIGEWSQVSRFVKQ